MALKVLHPDVADSLGVQRFLLEILTTAGLLHPNILPMFDSGEADGLLFFVMRAIYVAGWRAAGEIMQAQLELARGRPLAADAHVAAARPLEPSWTLEMRALNALLPALPRDTTYLRRRAPSWSRGRRRRGCRARASSSPSMPTFIHTCAATCSVSSTSSWATARASTATGASSSGSAAAPQSQAFARALSRSLDAPRRVARGRRRAHAASAGRGNAARTPRTHRHLPVLLAGRSTGFLRAEVLAAAGGLDEALRWFASLAEGPDVAFTGAHLRQWELLSQARRTDAAAGHARRLAELWSDAELTVRARAAGVFTSRLD